VLNSSASQSSNGLNHSRDVIFKETIQVSNDTLIPKSQIHEAVREALVEILGIQAQERTKQWYDVNEAYKLLDLKSAKKLREMIRSGLLRIGYEVRDCRSPNSQLPRYQVHIEKSLERLQKPPEKRR
jgi:predicted DNA-binding transcriptional regulator